MMLAGSRSDLLSPVTEPSAARWEHLFEAENPVL